jgi:lathosterol oxidase
LINYIEHIIYDFTYPQLYGVVFVYFLFLYFASAPLFLWIGKTLAKKGITHKIVDKQITNEQIKFELLHSFQSIVIFGFSAFPIIYLIRNGVIELLPDTVLNVIIGVGLLTIWNEIHFFLVHRLMHLPFFFKYVHKIHHKSKVPTVYSVYSFHWFEALLLSTVPLTITPFVSFAPLAIFLYPLTSILLNFSGHCNYRFGNGEGLSWSLFGTFHNEHHFKSRQNYGFASNLLDRLVKYFNF